MMRIQIKLTLIDDTGLAMRVLEQEGVERGIGNLWTDKDGGFSIISDSCPALCESTLFVRGNDGGDDNCLSTYVFDSPGERTEWIEAIREGITDLNEDTRVTVLPTEIIG